MRRARSAALAVVFIAFGLLLATASGPTRIQAVTPADKSEVVLVVDFSASILDDKKTRGRFAAALGRIADRVDETSSDLVAGDATISIVQFAATAQDYPRCVDIRLLGSRANVARFADCLRSLGKAYRGGRTARLTRQIGVDTNYVAAMQQAARHLPADAVRPALILFTDGRHDVAGVPLAAVQPARDLLFGKRSPFALLPVGMGLKPLDRAGLERGLLRLRIVRDMPTCTSGGVFAWPEVVFGSPASAGNAVALALQDITCTFTVAPVPTPTAAPTPAAVRAIALAAGDGTIKVNWIAGATSTAPGAAKVDGFRVRCRSGKGDWIESADGISTGGSAVVAGLTNGQTYRCEVASLSGKVQGAWTTATSAVTPLGKPAAPAKPSVAALNHGVRVQVPAVDSSQVSGFRYECSSDGGSTWTAPVQAGSTDVTTAEIGNLTNGAEYVCRAAAVNAAGVSGPSLLSDAVRPCGSLLECQPALQPVVGILGVVLVVGLLAAAMAIYRSRGGGYVVAVVDGVHSANLGSGSKLGVTFVRSVPHGPFTGIVPDRGPKADIRVRRRGGGRFDVSNGTDRVEASDGVPAVISVYGIRHEIVLRAFSTRTAQLAPTRR